MNLIEEAVIIELFGIRMYAFGLYTALGALCFVLVLAMVKNGFGLKNGTMPLTALLAMVFGMACSRITFCLLNTELGRLTPVSFWPQLSGGGWSMFGLIGGVYLGGWAASRIMREKTGRILDALSLSILPFIALERIGENRIDFFDISRALDSTLLKDSFLVVGEEELFLATYYIAAAVAVILFVLFVIFLPKRGEDGQMTIRFLLLFGASSIILESLRYDFFLSISFVGLQQVAAAIMLALGVFLAARHRNRPKSAFSAAAMASIPLMVLIVIGLEFALDRTTWNKPLIYVLMIITVSIPAAMGCTLLKKSR